MAISRMQNPQQLQGIGSLRQPYGLGKLVKKAFKGVKKIAKSPLGKAALLYAGTAGLGSLGSGQTGFARFAPSNFMGNLGRIGGFLTGKGGAAKTTGGSWLGKVGSFLNPWSGGSFSGKKAFGLGAAGLIAAPFIQQALGSGPYEDEEEEVDWTTTPSSIANIRNMARNQDPSLAFMPKPDYVQSGFYNLADGGRAGLLNGGGAGEAQMEQMLRAEYLKYKNKGGTMPYEQFKILVMKQSQQGQMPNQMMAADGGRAGFRWGGSEVINTQPLETYNIDEIQDIEKELGVGPMAEDGVDEETETMILDMHGRGMDIETISTITQTPVEIINAVISALTKEAQGGRIGAQEGGLMDLGGMEKDYRETGGFVEIGGEEKIGRAHV